MYLHNAYLHTCTHIHTYTCRHTHNVLTVMYTEIIGAFHHFLLEADTNA